MPSVETISFAVPPTRIGLVVRGKNGPNHHPGVMEQHADCILSDGSPVGFYGEGNGGSSNGVGMGMAGVVYDYDLMRRERPYYVDMARALADRVVSTVLLVEVDAEAARRFRVAWRDMTINPGNFNILGGNCSSHASAAFMTAQVLRGGIPGLDTPDRLYGQLRDRLPAARLRSLSGFVGFRPRAGGTGYDLTVMAQTDVASVNRPQPAMGFEYGGIA